MNRESKSITRVVPAGGAVYVYGAFSWSDSNAIAMSSDSCDALITKFVPESGKSYQVDFLFQGNSSCSHRLVDITQPAAPVPVDFETLERCER